MMLFRIVNLIEKEFREIACNSVIRRARAGRHPFQMPDVNRVIAWD
jgi:hypothetical protein